MLYKRVSLDLRLGDGMSFKTHLQVIDAETTYDILLGMEDSIVRRRDHVKELKSTDVDSFMTHHYISVTILRLKVFWR